MPLSKIIFSNYSVPSIFKEKGFPISIGVCAASLIIRAYRNGSKVDKLLLDGAANMSATVVVFLFCLCDSLTGCQVFIAIL